MNTHVHKVELCRDLYNMYIQFLINDQLNTDVKLYRFQDNNPTARSSFFKSVKVITTSASWLSLTFGIMIYLTLISTIFPYQCINLYHFFLFINIYELSFLYQSHDTKYKFECPKMFK